MKKIDFNQNWQFSKYGNGEKAITVSLPHDAMLNEERSATCLNGKSTGYFPGGKYKYEKTFFVSNDDFGKTIQIEFEGIYQRAEIYLNGEKIAFNPYGYTGFVLDLSDKLLYGKDNTLTVIADNSGEPSTRWYSGSGIYRPVSLYIGNKTHIEVDGVRVYTVSSTPAIIRVETIATGGVAEITIEKDGKHIISASGNDIEIEIPNALLWSADEPNLYTCIVILKENGAVVDTRSVNFGICHREWSTKGLFINGIETKLRGACIHHDNGILGACEYPTAALRRAKILKEAGFNAIRMAHNPASKALLDACDTIGLYVMDEFVDMWYEHKNRFDYATYFEDRYEEDLSLMIKKDISHPSVVMYSIGNEVTETAEPSGIEYTKKMTEICHKIDSTRPVTCGINMALNVMHFVGMGVYIPEEGDPVRPPEPKNPKALAIFQKMAAAQNVQPQKAEGDSFDAGMAAIGMQKDAGDKKDGKLVGSEYFNQAMLAMKEAQQNVVKQDFAKILSEDAYSALDIAGYNYAITRYELDKVDYPERISVGSETLPQKIYDNWKYTTACPYCVGDFIWTGWDYLGEAGIGSFCYDSIGTKDKDYPFLLAGSGIIDILGNCRPEVWLNKAVYGLTNAPYIGVEPITHAHENHIISAWRYSDAVHSWSWAGCEGRKADIVVYCNAPYVELILNGVSLGKKQTKECQVKFETSYVAGTLTAISYDDDGNVLGKDELCTASSDTVLKLTAEKDTLIADGQDLCYINIDLADENGITKASEDRMLTITVEGEGQLIGFGNAAPCTEEVYTDNVHSTFYGKCLAVVRSTENEGTISITVSADDLSSKTLTIHTAK